ncbi:MAG: NADH-quinone oxidoreductase subunit M [Pseudomonadota bacterium]
MDAHLLSIVTFLPAFAAIILAVLLRGDDPDAQRNAKWLAIITTGSTFLISLFIVAQFDAANTEFQFVTERSWLLGFTYRLGVDGISIVLVMLTTFMMPLIVLASWDMQSRVKEYMIAFLLLESFALGAFMALDLVLFFIFMEATMIPMFMIIGIWGGAGRIYASLKYLLYGLIGSALMLLGILGVYADAATTCIGGCTVSLLNHQFSTEPMTVLGLQVTGGLQTLLLLAFLASFAVKLPVWPLHSWLPEAHAQAPVAGSAVLSAILLKLGGYGLLRFALPMLPVGSDVIAPLIMWLSLIAILAAALMALVQDDMRRLIAYAAIGQMGFVTLGAFSATQQGIDGALFQMISHGLVIGALMICVGAMYGRMDKADVDAFGGLIKRMPVFALVFMVFVAALIGVPGTVGFVGVFLTLIAVFSVNSALALLAGVGLVLTGGYALWLYRRVMFGELIKESLKAIRDLSLREKWTFAPLVAATLLLGVYPALVLDLTGPSVAALSDGYAAALEAAARVAQTAEIAR